ncbi:MAG: enoyl-CoA hydratase/isomerase family protein [Rhodocyclales bacterium]|nr:enoyl-CoA hydratase/isomerase family protein [Rhodocyclales bacterium]
MTVRVEKHGAGSTVVIDRPETRNAIDRPTAQALAKAFREFDADPAQHVAVLCGANGHFCAGADLKAFVANPGEWSLSEEGDAPLDLILTGRAVDADEAMAMGLANRMVPAGEAGAGRFREGEGRHGRF